LIVLAKASRGRDHGPGRICRLGELAWIERLGRKGLEHALEPAATILTAALIGDQTASDAVHPRNRFSAVRHFCPPSPRDKQRLGDDLLCVFEPLRPPKRVGKQRSICAVEKAPEAFVLNVGLRHRS
jgi:hypothetical protein